MSVCEEAFGVFPCSTSVFGAAFLVIVYGSIIFHAAGWSVRRLEHLPRPFATVLPPALGSVPLAVLVLVAALSDRLHSENVAAGFGALAGNVLLLLSLAWGGAVYFGRCNLDSLDGWQISPVPRAPADLIRSGVSLEDDMTWPLAVMAVSTAFYVLVMVPAVAGFGSMRMLYTWAAALCWVCCVAYCSYQALGPGLRRYCHEARRCRHLRYNTVRSLAYYANRYGGILFVDGSLNFGSLSRIFQHFDRNKDTLLSREEMLGMVVGMDFAVHAKAGQHALIADYWMTELDKEGTGFVTEQRFCQVMRRWFFEKQRRFAADFPADPPKEVLRAGNAAWWLLVRKAPEDYCYQDTAAAASLRGAVPHSSSGASTLGTATSLRPSLSQSLLEDHEREASFLSMDMLEAASASEVQMPGSDSSCSVVLLPHSSGPTAAAAAAACGGSGAWGSWLSNSALAAAWRESWWAGVVVFLLATGVCATLAQPFVQQLIYLAYATHLPPVFVMMVAAPMAASGQQLLGWLSQAAARRPRSITGVVQQVVMAIIVNNSFGLGCLLAGLGWRDTKCFYSYEVIVIILVTLLLSGLCLRAGRRLPAVLGCAFMAMYPVGLFGVWLYESRMDNTLRI